MFSTTAVVAALSIYSRGVSAQSGAQPLGLAYGNNHPQAIKDSDVVSQAFPEVPGVELLSPAFTNPETIPAGFEYGTSGPTNYSTMDTFYRMLASRNDWLTYISKDFSSEEGRPMPYLYLTSSPSASSTGGTRLKVYIQAAIHGNEPSADQGAMALLGKMDANQTWTRSLLDKMDIQVLPRYNLDGVEYFQRTLANNYDPNREHLKLFRQQSRDIKRVFSEYSPDVSIDMHEYTASTIYGGEYQHAADALLSGGINLNIHPAIRDQVLNNFIPNMGASLEANGLRWEPYVTGSGNSTPGSPIQFTEAVTEARTGRNAYGLTQTISFLLETRGIRLANQHFQRRVATQLLKTSSVLETVRDDFDAISKAISTARQEFINSTDDIVVTDYYTPTERTFTLVDRANGSVVQVPVDFEATTPSIANLTRARPEAYLIPVTYYDVVERLRIMGLEVEKLNYEYRGQVEALNITRATLADSVYEGTVLTTVETETVQRDVHLPTGSYLISTRQKNAALAFVALEPENIDSYVAYNIIQLEENDQYPIFRVMK